jgi:hypothetical protein
MRLLVTTLLLLCAASYSQNPTPSPDKSSQPKQQQTQPEQRKSESNNGAASDQTSTSQQAIPPIAIWNEQCAAPHSYQEAPTDWWSRIFSGMVALFTGVLAVLAYKQWGVMSKQREAMEKQWGTMQGQLAQMKEQTTATSNAAAAAKNNAAALVNSERGWIEVFFERTNPSTGYAIIVKNHGRTAVQIIQCTLNERKVPIPARWVDPWKIPASPNQATNAETIVDWFGVDKEAGDAWGEIQAGTRGFSIIGAVHYNILLDNTKDEAAPALHKTTFRWDWDNPNKCLRNRPEFSIYD